jgi:hypothetical protein
MGMQRDLKQKRMIGRNERQRHCQQGSEERRSKVRKEVEDNRDTVSEISLTQCTLRLPEGSSTLHIIVKLPCRSRCGLGSVVTGK